MDSVPEKMKAVVVREIGSFENTRVPVDAPRCDEVLIKVLVTGLCRTDLKIIEVGHRDLVLPRIPGEEVVGLIQEKGEAVLDFEIGQPVYVYPGLWCGICSACRSGGENLCREMRIMGFHRDGGFAEYVTAPARSLIPIPEGLSPEEAVFAEPLSCCLNALDLAGPVSGKQVGIWGAGPAGTLLARAVAARGGYTVSMEPDDRRRKRIGCCYRHGQEALRLLAEGRIRVKDLVSHRLSLWDLDQGLEIVKNKKGMKVLLFPWWRTPARGWTS